MPDHVVDISDGSATERLELVDDPGPFNTWRARAEDIFGPAIKANFTNLSGTVHGRGCGAEACFILDGLDIDAVGPGDTGTGSLSYIGSVLKPGSISWTVVS